MSNKRKDHLIGSAVASAIVPGVVAHIEDVEEGLAIVGLFWAMRLLIERDEAWRDGAEEPFALHTCKYNDCGIRRIR